MTSASSASRWASSGCAGGGAQPRQVNEDVGFVLHQVDAAAAFQRLVQVALGVVSAGRRRGAPRPAASGRGRSRARRDDRVRAVSSASSSARRAGAIADLRIADFRLRDSGMAQP